MSTTPRPWKVEALRGCAVVIKTEQDLIVAVVPSGADRSRDSAVHDAELIVAAVNDREPPACKDTTWYALMFIRAALREDPEKISTEWMLTKFTEELRKYLES